MKLALMKNTGLNNMQQAKNPMNESDVTGSFDTLSNTTALGDDADINNQESLDEDKELTEQINDMLSGRQEEIKRKVNKMVRKHRRELKRLRILGENALINGNEEQYIYSIGKIRSLVGMQVPDDILRTMYKTSRERVLQLIDDYSNKE